MKMNVEEIAILSSQTGDGLKVGDKVIGCAKITKLKFEDDKTLTDYAKEGLNLGYGIVNAAEEGQNPKVEIADDLSGSSNYVLFIRDTTTGDTSVVINTLDLTNLFNLPSEDAVQMDKYLSLLANQRQLNMVRYTTLSSGEDAIFFTNQFDREMNEMLLDDETSDEETLRVYTGMLQRSEFRTELMTDNFIKIFLMSIVQTGQNRYNKLYKDDVIKKVADTLCEVTYWEDGVLYAPSVKDIDDFLEDVKKQIRIR